MNSAPRCLGIGRPPHASSIEPHSLAQIGFTLVEVLAALMIAATVATLAASVFTRATDAARRLDEERSALDRRSNSRRWLAAALRSLEVNADEGAGFYGDAQVMRFSSWLLTGDGWNERKQVELLVRDGALTASLGDGESIVLINHVEFAAFDYLTERGANAEWFVRWNSVIVPPIAVRVRVGRAAPAAARWPTEAAVIDTLLFAIGDRG